MNSMASAPSCLIFADNICVVWDATLSFWEVFATVVASGIVTWVTIYFSVKVAREATTRQLAAALDAERRERSDRDDRDARQAETQSAERRSRLAAALIRTVQQVESMMSERPRNPAYLATRAEWAALRVQFETSGEQNAVEFYEYADLTIVRGDEARPEFLAVSGEQLNVVEAFSRQAFANNLTGMAREWAREPELVPDRAKLDFLRAWRATNRIASYERTLEFLSLLENSGERPKKPNESETLSDAQESA
jgi:hypothetical protein